MAAIDITDVREAALLADVRLLFEEYGASLAIDLSFQGFEHELASLPGDYSQPHGTLLLARVDGSPAGCVGVRRAGDADCEMKRLYVRSAFQRLGLGAQLAGRALQWARRAGYARMLLDTLPSMTAAQRLYQRLGFTDIPAYRPNPIAGTRYLPLTL
ncbi:MAG: GNAT family N-acetyltransferase [Vicinamibacterales bacterium]